MLVSNSSSTGRTLRCVKYATEYLRAHGNDCLHRDYTLLKLKNDHRCIIPAYSEEDISGIAQAADTDSTIGKRNLAIILVAYCTGLRGIDIIGIKLSDIDWHNHKVSVVQSKTHTPIVSELNGATLKVTIRWDFHSSDYILDAQADPIFIRRFTLSQLYHLYNLFFIIIIIYKIINI